MQYRFPIVFSLLLSLPFMLSACGGTSILAGAGAQVLVTAAQERPMLTALDDKSIQLRVNARFFDESPDLFAAVETEVIEGRVLLTGNVDKPEHRVAASKLSWQVAGVKEVMNEVAVNDQSGLVNYLHDGWITTQMRTKMTTDPDIYDINYSIETVNGTIYVMGIAQNQREIDRVTGHARTIRGVRKIVRHVQTKDDPRRTAAAS